MANLSSPNKPKIPSTTPYDNPFSTRSLALQSLFLQPTIPQSTTHTRLCSSTDTTLHNISARCVKKSDALRHGEYLSRILRQTFHLYFFHLKLLLKMLLHATWCAFLLRPWEWGHLAHLPLPTNGWGASSAVHRVMQILPFFTS